MDKPLENAYAYPEYSDIENSRQNAIVKAAKAVGPSVVSVSVVQTRVVRESPFFSPFEDEFFNQFWGRFFGPKEYKEKIYGLGSGFIISEDGYVLTNEHVVIGADQIKVTLTNGEEYEAEIVGSDENLDLVVLKIKAEKLSQVTLGDSDDLIIGEWSIALGNPFGYLLDDPNPSVTVGVISALNRDIKMEKEQRRIYRKMIQTDAAINPGNSGGPLVNARGEVIGINTFIFTTSRGSEGIGFAIPINKAKRVLYDLIQFGKVNKSWAGVKVQNLTPLLAQSLNLDRAKGVIITDVYPDSPAEKKGLKRGDVITSVNEKKVKDSFDWEDLTTYSKPGERLEISYIRKGEVKKIQFKTEKLDTEIKGEYRSKLGMMVANITPQLAFQLDLNDTNGAFITSVEEKSKADRLGLRKKDIIKGINNLEISNVADFKEIEEKIQSNRKAVLFVEREREIYYLTFTY
ncbi:MAG: hypothetical protein AMJ90_02420 [candidate division Zixibacteria bacterium SM23_73_2]|nr:MAG: hypothetical protein AMJ90_02420 [candidate division Zixibacteria bacterium SM23_73_2]